MKSLLLMPLVLAVSASCWGQMTPHYDTYTAYSLDSSLNIYQTVVVEGYTSGSCFYTCGPNNQQCEFSWCSTATHTPQIYNVIGGSGGWSSGPASSPFSYMSYQTTALAQAQQGQVLDAKTAGNIICSVLGTLVGWPFLPIKIHWGWDNAWYNQPLTTNPLGNTCSWALANPSQCDQVCRAVRNPISAPCHDETDVFLSMLDAVPWIEWQIGSTVTGDKLYDSIFEQKLGSHVSAGQCTSIPDHWGTW